MLAILVVSAGGNDGLLNMGVMRERARSVAEAMDKLSAVREDFVDSYRAMVDAVTARGLPVALCTIYDAHFPDPQEQRLVLTGLAILNDVITREAFSRRLPLIDLRLICDEPGRLCQPHRTLSQGRRKDRRRDRAGGGREYDLSAVTGVCGVSGTQGARWFCKLRWGQRKVRRETGKE